MSASTSNCMTSARSTWPSGANQHVIHGAGRIANLAYFPGLERSVYGIAPCVGVPNRHLQEYLQSRFTEMMRAAASEVFGRATEVRFTIDPELFQAARREQQEHDNKTSRQGDKQTERPAVIGEDSAPPSPRPRVA